jgi:hypothetical protein
MASPPTPVNLFHGNANTVLTGGTAVVAIHALLTGGVIWNPVTASDQGIALPEKLYVSEAEPPGLIANQTTFALIALYLKA